MLATNVEYYSAVVLDVAEIPPPLAPAMFACSRVAGWSAHILEQKRTGRLFRPSARYIGPAERSLAVGLSLAEAGVEANALAESGNERDLAKLRAAWADELEAQARSEDYRERAAAYRAVGQFRFRQKEELLRRGLEDDSPACRGSALLSLELLSREHPRSVNSVRPLLHNLANADDNEAVRRLAILCAAERLSPARHDRPPAGDRRGGRALPGDAADRGEGRRGARQAREDSLAAAAGAAAELVAAGRADPAPALPLERALLDARPGHQQADAGDRGGEHREVWIGGHRATVIPARHEPETFRRRACGWLRK